MNKSINKIRNADFSKGKSAPTSWRWASKGKGRRWLRGDGKSENAQGITMVADKAAGQAILSQAITCKSDNFYRLEAVVSCDFSADKVAASDDEAGFFLSVQPMGKSGTKGPVRRTPGLRRSSSPFVVRGYIEVDDDDVKRLEVSVGIHGAAGQAHIHSVRVYEILEPEDTSNALAIPPPPFDSPAPRQAKSVCVCSDSAEQRLVTGVLSTCLGKANVSVLDPKDLRPRTLSTDALLLPDAQPPHGIRTVSDLTKLAAKQIVIVSLPAFAKLAKDQLSLLRVEQEDDPIHAKITFANHATRGFALHDQFPYCWEGKMPGSCVQNQFKKTAAFKGFCEKHGFITLLESVCNREVTSERPISLYKETPGGGLFVLDIGPIEEPGSSFDEPALATYLLLSILGQGQNRFGRFSTPVRCEEEFRETIREMPARFGNVFVHDADVPSDEVEEQLLTVGREDETFGLPLVPKPVILIRSGLTSGDTESVYAAIEWIKQLVRMEPHVCPYATALSSRFRMAWIPAAAPWEVCDGWRASGRPPTNPITIETDGAELSLLVDIVSHPINRVRVVFAKRTAGFNRCAQWLPGLWRSFGSGSYFAPSVPEGARFNDRDAVTFKKMEYTPSVVVDRDAFADDAYRDMARSASNMVRIEIPGGDCGSLGHSIQRTDLGATLLEHVVGLQFGLIAVNRGMSTVRFNGFRPVPSGQALIVDEKDPMLRARASRTA